MPKCLKMWVIFFPSITVRSNNKNKLKKKQLEHVKVNILSTGDSIQ